MRKRPRTRRSDVYDFEIVGVEGQGVKGYLTVSKWEDGSLMEIFIKLSKHGSTIGGLTETIAILVSYMAQAEPPLPTDKIIEGLLGIRFEPMGVVEGDDDVKWCQSIPDYIGRKLAALFLDEKQRMDMGIDVVRGH